MEIQNDEDFFQQKLKTMDTVDYELLPEDEELIKRIIYQDEKYTSETEIMDALIQIYNFHDSYQEISEKYQQIKKCGNKYYVQKKINFIKSLAFSIASIIVAKKYIFENDPFLASDIITTSIATIIGYNCFERMNKEENLEKVKISEQADEIFFEVVTDYSEKFVDLLDSIATYIEKYDEGENWQELSKKIFINQKTYIEYKKDKLEVNQDFSEQTMNDLLNLYFEDDRSLNTVIEIVREKNKLQEEINLGEVRIRL